MPPIEKPDVSHLQVFSCGAYVFLPEDIRANKLSPKLELMVYLGQPVSYKGFCFYWLTNGWIFIGAMAVFDETLFPCYPHGKQHFFTEIDDKPPFEKRYLDDPSSKDNNFGDHLPFPLENDGDAPPSSPPSENNNPTDHPSHTQHKIQNLAFANVISK